DLAVSGAGHAIEVTASGAQSAPPANVRFRVKARFRYDDRTRELGYAISLVDGPRDEVGGVYLHRRTSRPNGGVAPILAKTMTASVSGTVTLLEAEAADLKAGKCYLSVVSRKNPRLSARADIVFPSA